MAQEYVSRYTDQNPLVICFLNGGAPFTAELMFRAQALAPDLHPEVRYMKWKSYDNDGERMEPTLEMDLPDSLDLTDRVVVILEDIADTGNTAIRSAQHLHERGAKQVDLIPFIKRGSTQLSYPPIALFGFEVQTDVWLGGMGMDSAHPKAETYRWLNHIVALNPVDAASA
jgi:hypoxanthine phosphoribosyltransferase